MRTNQQLVAAISFCSMMTLRVSAKSEHKQDYERPQPTTCCEIGEFFMDRGNAKEAEFSFLEAISLQPGCERAIYDLAVLRKKQRSYSESEELFRKVIALSPGNHLAWYGLETSLLHLNRLNECKTAILSELKLPTSKSEREELMAFLDRVERRLQANQSLPKLTPNAWL